MTPRRLGILVVLALVFAPGVWRALGGWKAVAPPPPGALVIPEGATISELAVLLEKEKVCKGDEFEALARRFALEGKLMPGVYDFRKGVGAEEPMALMLLRFRSVILKDYLAAKTPDLLFDQAVTLASIVQKESERPEDRPYLAAVYRSRLKRHMKLPGRAGYGLPAKPLGLVGRDAFRAVLDAPRTDAVEFVRQVTWKQRAKARLGALLARFEKK